MIQLNWPIRALPPNIQKRVNLCVENLVTATMFVPISVDVCSDVDDLRLDEAGSGRRRRGCGRRSNDGSVTIILGSGRWCCRRLGWLLGGLWLGLGCGTVVFSGCLAATHVEIHVCVDLASLSLDVIGKNVRHLVAGLGIGAGEDRAPCVGSRGLEFADLVTGDEVVSVLPSWAVQSSTVNIRNVEVVESEILIFIIPCPVVLQLGDIFAFAFCRLGELDRDTNFGVGEVVVVLRIGLAGL